MDEEACNGGITVDGVLVCPVEPHSKWCSSWYLSRFLLWDGSLTLINMVILHYEGHAHLIGKYGPYMGCQHPLLAPIFPATHFGAKKVSRSW